MSNIQKTITISLASILVSLFSFEIVGQMYFRELLRADIWVKLRTDGLKYSPNVQGKFKNSEMSYNVSINADGFRDDTVKASLTKRDWIAVGDSFTFGFGVEFREVWHQLLEDRLNIQIYNAGVAGTQVRQFINNYYTNLNDAEHDGVLMSFFTLNDYVTEKSPDAFQVSENRDFLYYRWRLLVFLSSHSVIYNVIRNTFVSHREAVNINRPNTKIFHVEHKYTCDLLTIFSESLGKKGKKFILVIIPDDSMILNDAPKRSHLYTKVKSMVNCLRSNNVKIVNPSQEISEMKIQSRQKLYFRTDRHFTRYGNSIFAQSLINNGIQEAMN